jgi:hypothetical protein
MSVQPSLTFLKRLIVFIVSLLDQRTHVFFSVYLFLLLVYPQLPLLPDPLLPNLLPNPLPLLLLIRLPLLKETLSIICLIFPDIRQLA